MCVCVCVCVCVYIYIIMYCRMGQCAGQQTPAFLSPLWCPRTRQLSKDVPAGEICRVRGYDKRNVSICSLWVGRSYMQEQTMAAIRCHWQYSSVLWQSLQCISVLANHFKNVFFYQCEVQTALLSQFEKVLTIVVSKVPGSVTHSALLVAVTYYCCLVFI